MSVAEELRLTLCVKPVHLMQTTRRRKKAEGKRASFPRENGP